jgi:hypothetical protein
MIRRLDPTKDRGLYVDAFLFDLDAPRWYRESDKIWRPETFERYMELAHGDDQIDIGVFENGLIGLVTITRRAQGIYEGHLSAKRNVPRETLSSAVYQIRHQLFEIGMQEAFVWVASKNRGVIKICEESGFYDNFVTMLKGSYHGRVIEWRQMVTTRAQWESEQVRLAA